MRFYALIMLSCSLVLLGGCARDLPLMSHAHVGHALTAWRDTPNEEGLFVTAEQEAAIALQQAHNAAGAANATVARQHLTGVVHALDPERMAQGSASGYGGIRALAGAASHLKYAAEADDASRNIVRGADVFVAQAVAVLEHFKLAVDVAVLAQQARDIEISGLAAEAAALLNRAVNGSDLDGNGTIGNTVEETGLKHMREQLAAMLRRENPSYHPVGRPYLLGLVQLPSGRWAYRFSSAQSGRESSKDGY
jgi:hypothetical protein